MDKWNGLGIGIVECTVNVCFRFEVVVILGVDRLIVSSMEGI